MDKVIIQKLPYTREGIGAKRWLEERGEFVQIAYREEIRHLALFEIKGGFSRGNHYHKRKDEFFYVASGKIKARFVDMETLVEEESVLEKGDKVNVAPYCGHTFYGLEDALVVEYSPQIYDPGDRYPMDSGRVMIARQGGKGPRGTEG